MIRLNHFLAQAGLASRRAADQLIESGQVKVNDQVVKAMGSQVDPANDVVEVDGQRIQIELKKITYLLNKPAGVVTTAHDPDGRPTVLDLVPKEPRVFPCGRLDTATLGLVILTNDGDLCYQLTHPKFEVQKEYLVDGHCSNPQAAIAKLLAGVRLKDGPAKADAVKILKASGNQVRLAITIHDGRNRIVRRMAEAVGIDLTDLTRTKMGRYELGDIKPGEYKIAESQND